MAKEVVQLREMINQCVKSYNLELEAKDAEIRDLKLQFGLCVDDKSASLQFTGDQPDQKRNSLEVIQ